LCQRDQVAATQDWVLNGQFVIRFGLLLATQFFQRLSKAEVGRAETRVALDDATVSFHGVCGAVHGHIDAR
jgi:hypothetical protein